MSSGVPYNDLVELTSAPAFDFGEKVRANRIIRNDGTYAGREIGDILAKKGEVGYVVSIGTFLQKFYIYGVEFIESGNRVGMKREELDRVVRGGRRPAVAQELSTTIEAEPQAAASALRRSSI